MLQQGFRKRKDTRKRTSEKSVLNSSRRVQPSPSAYDSSHTTTFAASLKAKEKCCSLVHALLPILPSMVNKSRRNMEELLNGPCRVMRWPCNAMADAFKRKPEVEVSRWLIRNNKEKLLYVVVYPKFQKNPL